MSRDRSFTTTKIRKQGTCSDYHTDAHTHTTSRLSDCYGRNDSHTDVHTQQQLSHLHTTIITVLHTQQLEVLWRYPYLHVLRNRTSSESTQCLFGAKWPFCGTPTLFGIHPVPPYVELHYTNSFQNNVVLDFFVARATAHVQFYLISCPIVCALLAMVQCPCNTNLALLQFSSNINFDHIFGNNFISNHRSIIKISPFM